MPMARQCDRCGVVFVPYRKRTRGYEQKPTAFVNISIGAFDYKTEAPVDNASTAYDLCPKCSKQLSVFLENPNITVEQYLNDKVKANGETIKVGDEGDDW